MAPNVKLVGHRRSRLAPGPCGISASSPAKTASETQKVPMPQAEADMYRTKIQDHRISPILLTVDGLPNYVTNFKCGCEI